MNVPHLLDFLEASLSGKALDKARRNQGRTDWTGVQTQYSEKWSLFWSVAALKTVVYPFHFISFLTHQMVILDHALVRYDSIRYDRSIYNHFCSRTATSLIGTDMNRYECIERNCVRHRPIKSTLQP